MEQKSVIEALPVAEEWVNSPLRNRLRLQLNANAEDVWALVGDPANMPQYSEGLTKVETEKDEKGKFIGYTCFFKLMEGEQEGIIHRTNVKWHEKNKGWASIDPDDNPFGMFQSLSLMTLEPENGKTIFTWLFHFDCENEETLNYNKEGYKKALEDISQRLVKRFGGTELENYVEGRKVSTYN